MRSRSSTSSPRRQFRPLPSRKPRLGRTPVARMTTSASRRVPPTSSATRWPSCSWMAFKPEPVWMPICLERRCVSTSSAALASSMYGSNRGSRSITSMRQPRLAIALRTMNPMKPAPRKTTRDLSVRRFRTLSVSARVQRVSTPGASAPGNTGRTADPPVAMSRSSYSMRCPSWSVTAPALVSTKTARFPKIVSVPRSLK